MSVTTYPVRAKSPELVESIITLTGTGAAVPTKNHGAGVTMTRTGAGVYVITYAENNGNWLGLTGTFGATTASAVKGYTLTYGLYSATAFSVAVSLWDSSFAAVDLAALQYLTIRAAFKRTGVSG